MEILTYGLLLLGALAGGFVSGLAGFGTALMALGIWLYVLPPSLAVPLVLICSVIAQSSTLPSMWKSFDLSLVWPFLIGGLIGVPLGTMLVASADPKVFKLSVGVLILVFSTALYLNKRPLAVTFGGRIADGAIGFAGGILGGLAGLSGGHFRSCGQTSEAGTSTSGAASSSSSISPCSPPPWCCRPPRASSRSRWSGSQ
ncbi:putative membrane protein YfcA [Bradyrhizobium sp. GM22.5]